MTNDELPKSVGSSRFSENDHFYCHEYIAELEKRDRRYNAENDSVKWIIKKLLRFFYLLPQNLNMILNVLEFIVTLYIYIDSIEWFFF